MAVNRKRGGPEPPGPPSVSSEQMTVMANASQRMWTAIRDCSEEELEALAFAQPELSAALVGVRRAMIG